MKRFTAYHTARYGGDRAIITVHASNVNDALALVEIELAKPGRGAYLKRWKRDGMIIREREQFPPVEDDYITRIMEIYGQTV